MNLRNRVVKSFCALVASCALAVGAFALMESPAEARTPPGECICLHIYAPVTCDGGLIFSNQCFANCAGATGCVPGILQ